MKLKPLLLTAICITLTIGVILTVYFSTKQSQELFGETLAAASYGVFFCLAFIILSSIASRLHSPFVWFIVVVLFTVSTVGTLMWQSTNYSKTSSKTPEYSRLEGKYKEATASAAAHYANAKSMPANYTTNRAKAIALGDSQTEVASGISSQMAELEKTGGSANNHGGAAFNELAAILPFGLAAVHYRLGLQVVFSILLDICVGLLGSLAVNLSGVNTNEIEGMRSSKLTSGQKFLALPDHFQTTLLNMAYNAELNVEQTDPQLLVEPEPIHLPANDVSDLNKQITGQQDKVNFNRGDVLGLWKVFCDKSNGVVGGKVDLEQVKCYKLAYGGRSYKNKGIAVRIFMRDTLKVIHVVNSQSTHLSVPTDEGVITINKFFDDLEA